MYTIIDINGAYSVYKLGIPAVYVAVLPKDEETLNQRLKGRGTESEEVIQGRLNTAKEELKRISETPFFNYRVINDNLESATEEMYNDLKKEYTFL